jgi:hypothetical protein
LWLLLTFFGGMIEKGVPSSSMKEQLRELLAAACCWQQI